LPVDPRFDDSGGRFNRTGTLISPTVRGEIDRDSTVLYAHLGGQSALNGYSALF